MTTAKVFYLGPEGSYSSAATQTLFPTVDRHPCKSFEEIFEQLGCKSGFGVLPLENNTAGAVDPAIDLLIASPLSVCAEYHMNVCHSFASCDQDLINVHTLYSMPQPYYQSYQFIQKHLQHAQWVQCPSSSDAMARCLEQGSGAGAIGARSAAQALGLNILHDNIQDRVDNRTRFVVIAAGDTYRGPLKACDRRIRASVVFTLEDRPGTLLDALDIFKRAELNMSHIESRPSKDPRWNYNFLVTLQCESSQREDLEKALLQIEQSTPWSRTLGCYPLLLET